MRIGLVLELLNNDYCDNIVKYVAKEISSRNAHLVVIECINLDQHTPETISGNMVYKLVENECLDGVIIITSTMSSENTKELLEVMIKKIEKPVVSVGVKLDGIPSVILDYKVGFDAVISHFASHGIKDLAFISGPLSDHDSLIKYNGFVEAAKEHQLDIAPHLVLEGTGGYMAGYNCGKRLVPYIKNGSVKAIVCSNDELALSAIKYFRENNINIPKDVSVSGYNNSNLIGYNNPSLTTVDRKFEHMLKKSITVLFEQIFGYKNNLIYSFTPELIMGQTCGCDVKSAVADTIFYPWTRFYGLRGSLLGLDYESMSSKLAQYLHDNNVSQCYVVQNITPKKSTELFEDNPKGTLFFGYSKGMSVTYSKHFCLSEILPKHILNNIKEPMLVKTLFMNKRQYGFLFISISVSNAAFIDDLALELSQYLTYLYIISEQKRLEKESADTHESLMISNRRLNELSVKDNLDKLLSVRHLASNMLQSREGNKGEYALIIVEIDNFHEINSRYGFSEGEFVISCVSSILGDSIRDDDFLTHQCCERYILLVKNIQSDPAVTISNRFLKALNELNYSLKKPYAISFSWGYAQANVENDFGLAYNKAEHNLLINKQKSMPRI